MSELAQTTTQELTTRLAGWLRRLPPEQDRILTLAKELDAGFGARTDPVTEDACREIERTAWRFSRHLELQFDPTGTDAPDEESKGWDESDPADVRSADGPGAPARGVRDRRGDRRQLGGPRCATGRPVPG